MYKRSASAFCPDAGAKAFIGPFFNSLDGFLTPNTAGFWSRLGLINCSLEVGTAEVWVFCPLRTNKMCFLHHAPDKIIITGSRSQDDVI